MANYCSECGKPVEGEFCSNCGASVEKGETGIGNPLSIFLKGIGLKEVVNVLLSVHKPVQTIKTMVATYDKSLKVVMLAYIEFITLVPFVHKEFLLKYGNEINYPLIFQGEALENSVIYYLLSAAGALVGLFVIYLFPEGMLKKETKPKLLLVNLIFGMYTMIYITAGDVVKFIFWPIFESWDLMVVIGSIVIISVTILQIYIWRKILEVKWITIVLLSVFGFIYGAVFGYVLASAGLLTA